MKCVSICREKFSNGGREMSRDEMLRIIFAILAGALWLVQIGWRVYLTRLASKQKASDADKSVGEMTVNLAGMSWAVMIVLYSINASLFDVSLPLFEWIRWIGITTMALCIP